MKKLTVVVANLGWNTLERRGKTRLSGINFTPANSVFPAVTCVAQASLRTGLDRVGHGIHANGYWFDDLRKPLFWEQCASIVKGDRLWGRNTGVFFFQQSLGEDVELLISPAPIHKHGGGMIMACYTKPTEMEAVLKKLCGGFPLWRYWGPLASPKVGRKCIDYFEAATQAHDVDEAYLYLPTLDYMAQKYGPDSSQDLAAFAEFEKQLARLVAICERRGASLVISGDYEITPVDMAPSMPNVALRKAGLFRTRSVAGMAYPDFYQSRAFAMCDHEIAAIYGTDRDKAVEALIATREYDLVEAGSASSPPILIAKKGSWCDYRWWTNPKEAPDFASHVDIHNKPGFDPRELFFFCKGIVKGTHGRRCQVASSGFDN